MRWCRRITVRATSPEEARPLTWGRWRSSTIGLSTGGRVYGSAEPMAHSPSTVTLGSRDRPGVDAPGAIPRRWSHVARADKWAVALYIAIPVLMGVPPALVGKTSLPREWHGRQRDTELPTTSAVGRAAAARSAAAVGPVHLERDAPARGMERGIPVPGYVALRHHARRRGVDDQRRLGVGDMRHRDARLPAPARLLTARGTAGRVDVHLLRVHVGPSSAPRPRPRHELHSLDAARRPRAGKVPRAA